MKLRRYDSLIEDCSDVGELEISIDEGKGYFRFRLGLFASLFFGGVFRGTEEIGLGNRRC